MSGCALDFEGGVEQLRAPTHVGEALRSTAPAAPSGRGGVEPGAIVADLECEAATGAGHPYRDAGRVGMSKDVAECLGYEMVELFRLLRA